MVCEILNVLKSNLISIIPRIKNEKDVTIEQKLTSSQYPVGISKILREFVVLMIIR